MGFEYVSKLPTPDEIRAQFPLAPELAAEKARKDAAIRDVFTGDSDKFLVIIGPCSADREDAVIDYVNRLAKVQEKVKDKLILVPRIYTNKPRTTGDGYKGLLHQPNPEGRFPDTVCIYIIAVRCPLSHIKGAVWTPCVPHVNPGF